MPDIKPRYLIMVTASANNNKYYNQIPNGDSWTAEYNRVGRPPQRRTYPMSLWDKKYNEKINKGYVDNTELIEDLIVVDDEESPQYKPIENKSVAEIVDRLQRMAKETIQKNYKVSSNAVTQAMVDEAQIIINDMVALSEKYEKDETILSKTKTDKINEILLHLFTVIPRKMNNVNTYLVYDAEKIPEIIKREQDLLDVMAGQVAQKIEVNKDTKDKGDTSVTILEKLGLIIEECNSNDVAQIKVALGDSVDKFYRAWKVVNLKTQKRYDNFIKNENITNTKLLFHGSRNENWWSIINSGLVLRPTNAVITGKLYGYGIYFAPKARKSLGYTSLSGSYWARGSDSSGFMALMEIAYGVPYDVYDFNSKYGSMTYESLQNFKKGANCLHAHAGASMGYSSLKNDEIIVYKEEQCTIKYLVELKNN